jgi:predicted metal-dependent phosphoesterase TrpH
MDAYPVPVDLSDRCVTGLEVDTYGFGQTVHVLAYGLRRAGALLSRLKAQQQERSVRARSIIEHLNRLGMDLDFEQVLRFVGTSASVGRPHIARALVEAAHCSTMQEAFDKYLAEDGAAYVPLQRLSTSEALDLIRDAGGIAVLAHPRRIRDQSRLAEVIRLFDGVEVLHPSADDDYQHELFDIIDANGMIATGGTDFHGRPEDAMIGVQFPTDRLNAFLERLSVSARELRAGAR